ncbi:transposon Ty3-I Gag-Pol polyprotein [Trichonephila clavipes]|nr:transposon Ty3-I Gag-Pol polyprotein [Trichonephila clavipes]
MHVAVRFSSVLPPYLEENTLWGARASHLSSPTTNLTRGLAARRNFRVPRCREVTTPMPSLGLMAQQSPSLTTKTEALITIRRVEVAANQGAATILRDDIASTISDSGRSVSLAANSGYLSRTEKPDVNSLWIVEQTSRSSLGQKRKLLIDLHNRKLIDGVTNLSIKGEVATIQENNDLSTVNRASKYFNLLKLYPDLTKPNLVNRVVKHEVKHHILTTGQPVYSKARQLAPDKLKLAKQEFQFMLDNDIIRPSKSQWASPLHLVNKKGWHIKTMWRLQATQRTDNTRSISNS